MDHWTLDEVMDIYAEILARIIFLGRHPELPYDRQETLLLEIEYDVRLLSDAFKLRLIKEDKRPLNDRRNPNK